ncbi:gamma-secretase subunit aph-1 [Anaeramoeba flamelloides]|uniref:Gamma-secretase subunit aph-1 n=1 Tax=Anaeramoeba flamelloides TaxID=1746091 RepID=A0AAV8A6A3_9EUKA|nr:gamma-secretase subunit aph-1 [Anaeramoeba flamelloides]
MTISRFLGCLLISYSPLIALFLKFILKDSKLLIISLSGAFFWMLSIFLSSILWFVVSPWKKEHIWSIIVSFIFQEVVRFLCFKLWNKLETSINLLSRINKQKRKINYILGSIACGVGFGFGYVLVMHTGVLTNVIGPADLYTTKCNMSLFVLNSFYAQAFGLLNVIWTSIMFLSIRNYTKKKLKGKPKRKYLVYLFVSIISHLVESLILLVNSCTASLLVLYLILAGLIILLVKLIVDTMNEKKNEYNLLKQNQESSSNEDKNENFSQEINFLDDNKSEENEKNKTDILNFEDEDEDEDDDENDEIEKNDDLDEEEEEEEVN